MLQLESGWRMGEAPFNGDPLGKGHPFIHGSHGGESNLAAAFALASP